MSLAVIILAAGEGTRMKSSRPKVLHEICGIPMIRFVLDAARTLEPDRIVVVVGHRAEEVREALDTENIDFAFQEEQRGTGHAVLTAGGILDNFNGTVIILSGDTPLVRNNTLKSLLERHKRSKAVATLMTARLKDPTGYGRIVRSDDKTFVESIVEQKDATSEQLIIDEVNSGTYCFDKGKLFEALKHLGTDNAQGEQYLTDVIGIFCIKGETITASVTNDSSEIMGVNTRVQLAEADSAMRARINEEHMLAGVTIVDPKTTYIAPGVAIGKDTIIYPMTFMSGATRIGANCVVGPMATLVDCEFGDMVKVENSVIRECIVGDNAALGPYCHIRPGTVVKTGAKIGGFVEVKKSEIGKNSKVPHLSYVGDTIIGEDVNIGAGTITCNYDGANKYRTIIEDKAFIGSDTMLVAPVRVGKGSFTGAGSVITKDVPEDSLSVERTEQNIFEDWAKKRREKKGKLECEPDD